ncbi:XrtA-associated tyrosine autokinase [Nitratidesulfovibrio sp.]|uniref:XrtA-associated tyrosine autokinase n=1 Tax=Nitratidesulfovibrio sp. TaxID=2802297 RepID=UPI00333F2548
MSRIEEALERARREQQRPAEGGSGPPSGPLLPALIPTVPPPFRESTPPPDAQAESPRRQVRLDSKLIAAAGFGSPLGEEYRKLKERIVHMARRGGSMNMFMVTSSVMGEGKTLVSANLAISLAQEFDSTVLLVDADLRAPSSHLLFGVDTSPGLSECLLDNVPLSQALVPTGVGRLSFLPAGRQLQNPGELFASSRMEIMLQEMKRRYSDRYIIIDTAPVLPFAETRILSRIVDGVLLVARENMASVDGLRSTFEAIEGANVLGVVYNDASRVSWPSYPGYGDRYGLACGYGRRDHLGNP